MKNQHMKVWRRKESKELPSNIKSCMVSGGVYGFIMSCMQIFNYAAISKSVNVEMHVFRGSS